MSMRIYSVLCLAILFLGCSPSVVKSPSDSIRLSDHATLLPNGHTVTPAGYSIEAGSFPLGMSLSPDGKNIVVVNSGFGDQTLTLVNVPK